MSSPRKQLNDQAYDPLTTYGTGSNLDYQITNATIVKEFKSVSFLGLIFLCSFVCCTVDYIHSHLSVVCMYLLVGD